MKRSLNLAVTPLIKKGHCDFQENSRHKNKIKREPNTKREGKSGVKLKFSEGDNDNF
jgi:hypothetical protein